MLRERAMCGMVTLTLAVGICGVGCGAAGVAGGRHGVAPGGPTMPIGSGGNYARLPGTIAEHRGYEDIGAPEEAPSAAAGRASKLIDGDLGTLARTYRDIYIWMDKPHPLSRVVIRGSNYLSIRVYVGPLGQTRQGEWKLVHNSQRRLPDPIVLDVLAVTDRVKIQVISITSVDLPYDLGDGAGTRMAAEIELYGSNVSRDTLLGSHLARPDTSRDDRYEEPVRPLEYIGEVIARTSPSGMADVIVLTTETYDDERPVGAVVHRDLIKLVKVLNRKGIDYRFTAVAPSGARWTKDPNGIGERLAPASELPPFTALIHALRIASDRGADLHCVYATDGPVTVEEGDVGSHAELTWRIWGDAASRGIRMHVFGYDEKFQRQLARRTGGAFQKFGTSTAHLPSLDELSITLEPYALRGHFEAIAESATRWIASNEPTAAEAVNVVFFVDYSLSMQGRLRSVANGLRAFDRVLREAKLKPTYTLVRFAKTVGDVASGVSGSTVSLPTPDIADMPLRFRYPALGDERLVESVSDALLDATDPTAPNVAVIVTDEPPRSREDAVESMARAVKTSAARCYAIMPSGDAGQPGVCADAVTAIIEGSGGMVFPMPRPVPMSRADM
jgi:hypothetical protein